MGITKSTVSVAVLAATFAFAGPAAAAEGIQLSQRITNGTTETSSEVQIERTRMRAEISSGGESQVVIYDGNSQVLRIVSPARQSYLEITKADFEQMAAMMKGLMAQLANLPPAQRAQMEGMMRGRGMGMQSEPITYKKVGTDRVGRWNCDKYEAYRGEQKTSELCTVPPDALGITDADLAVTQQLAEFVRSVLPQGGDQVVTLGRGGADGFSGVPVRTITNALGSTVTSELTAVTRKTFDDATFAVPAGFTKQAMPGMGRMGGR